MSLTEFEYFTIDREYDSLYKDRGSKFLGFVFPCNSEDVLASRVQELKELHSKAVHHVWAIRLRSLERSSDDGEPSGTAGKPMLGQLIKNDLYDVGAVVVRYYGGVNLGTGGLIKAYKTAVEIALESVDRVVKEIRSNIAVTYEYKHMAAIEKLQRITNWKVKSQEFGEKPTITFAVVPNQLDRAIIKIKATVGEMYEGEVGDDTQIEGLEIIK